MRLIPFVLLVASMAALAQDKQVSVPVGYTTTLDMPANVTKVTLSDPSVVKFRQRGRTLTFTGTRRGSSEAIIHTGAGKHVVATRVAVYVASNRYALPY